MSKDALISIIIPVYNVKEYLERCLISIISQTYSNLEILLIDDGSDDGSEYICDEFEKKYKNIKVIHKKNGGLSSARNVGIEMAKGSFLAFVDSDDFVHPQMIEILYNEIKKNNAQVAICAIEKVYDEKDIQKIKQYYAITSNGKDSIEKMYSTLYPEMIVAWNKLYNKNCFENIKFPEGVIHEDEYVTWKVLYNAKRCVYISEPLYYYFQRKGSIMLNDYTLKRIDRIQALEERLIFFENENEINLSKKTLKKLLDDISWNIIQIKKNYSDESMKLKILWEKYRFYSKKAMGSLKFSLINRCKIILFLFNEDLYYLVKCLSEKGKGSI